EDGIRDFHVTGVQTCALPILIRLPTRMSDGKANLHQGAIGVGIDIPSGVTKRGVWGTEIIREHPDTEHSIVGLSIPRWDELLHKIGRATCRERAEAQELGYPW